MCDDRGLSGEGASPSLGGLVFQSTAKQQQPTPQDVDMASPVSSQRSDVAGFSLGSRLGARRAAQQEAMAASSNTPNRLVAESKDDSSKSVNSLVLRRYLGSIYINYV